MLDTSLPAFNNMLLAICLLGLLGVAHFVAHKRKVLGQKDLRNRLHVAWAITLIGLPAVLYPKSLGIMLWGILPLLAWQEWITQVHVPETRQANTWWLGSGIYLAQLICVAAVAQALPEYGWATAILPVLVVLAAIASRPWPRRISAGIAATLLLPALALPLLMHARLSVLVWCFLIPQLFDAFQYVVGRKWGRTQLSRWSPKKTWEGLLGGAVLAWICAMALSPWLPWPEMQTAQMTIVLLAAAYCGGLASSMLKRFLGFKDWGTRLGSHGGVLDRMDSMVFSIPIAWAFYTWHLHFGLNR